MKVCGFLLQMRSSTQFLKIPYGNLWISSTYLNSQHCCIIGGIKRRNYNSASSLAACVLTARPYPTFDATVDNYKASICFA